MSWRWDRPTDHLSADEIMADLIASTVRPAKAEAAEMPSIALLLARIAKERARFAEPGRYARYDAYMGSPAWRQLRERALLRALGRCEECQVGGRGLHVHHLTYQRFGAETLDDVRVLCAPCHQREHEHGPSLPKDRAGRREQIA